MKRFLSFFALILFFSVIETKATIYEVKPNTPLETIAEVPWATLQPGDTVLIYWNRRLTRKNG